MKTIGLLGGMSWESSLDYYRIINEGVKEKLGGLHSAKILMYSFNFEEIRILQQKEEWEKMSRVVTNAAKILEKGGADCVLICTNTMHKMADYVQENISIPLLHIADATAEKIKEKKIKKVGLLGTKFTMEHDFYKDRLKERYGIEVFTPNEEDRNFIDDVIFNELCIGLQKQPSRERFIRIITDLIKNGAEGIILGCTEIPHLIKNGDIDVPIFDTTEIHAKVAVKYAID